MATTLKKYSVNITGHSTSITLEESFWESLKKIARQEDRSIASIIAEVDQKMNRTNHQNLSSHVRVYILDYWVMRVNPVETLAISP